MQPNHTLEQLRDACELHSQLGDGGRLRTRDDTFVAPKVPLVRRSPYTPSVLEIFPGKYAVGDGHLRI